MEKQAIVAQPAELSNAEEGSGRITHHLWNRHVFHPGGQDR
jgi:hypothetical protein